LGSSGPSGDLVPELDGVDGLADQEVDFQSFTCLHISCEGSPLSSKAMVCLFEKFEEIMIKLKERGLVGEILNEFLVLKINCVTVIFGAGGGDGTTFP
jgi:hypothetical protein